MKEIQKADETNVAFPYAFLLILQLQASHQ
jgi:hypothetical protein